MITIILKYKCDKPFFKLQIIIHYLHFLYLDSIISTLDSIISSYYEHFYQAWSKRIMAT